MTHATAQPSMRDRLTHTPMRDLIRGRVTGRLDFNARIAQAGLNPKAEALVKQTVRRTRLWRLEKTAVADELIAHFRDAAAEQARHPDAPDPVAAFGNPKSAAKLIRRAKKRQRSLATKAAVIAGQTAAVLLLVYGLLSWSFYGRIATLTIDYVARLSAAYPAPPADQAAWPLYRAAWSSHQLADFDHRFFRIQRDIESGREIRPHDPEWPQAVADLAGIQPLLNDLYRAAGRPDLGQPVLRHEHLTAEAHLALYGTGVQTDALSHPTPNNPQNPEFDFVLENQQLWLFRKSIWLLRYDTLVAADAGDGDRVTRNFLTSLRMIPHIAQTPALRAHLQSLSIFTLPATQLQQLLVRQPELFTDAHLARLSDATRALNPRNLVDLTADRLYAYDLFQRSFTDNGRGDGRLLPDVVRENTKGPSGCGIRGRLTKAMLLELPWLRRVAEPAAGWTAPTRRTTRERFDAAMRLLEARLTQPVRDHPQPLWVEMGLVNDTPTNPILSLTLGDIDAIRLRVERAIALREGTALGIALEQCRRDNHGWPERLTQLIPSYLSTLPVDPITGGPLHYQIADGHPLVYSVGDDRDDDGGVAPRDSNGDARPTYAAFVSLDGDQPPHDGDWILYPIPNND